MEIEKIIVKFAYALFENNTGYSIFQYTDVKTNQRVTCVGNYLPQNKNLSYEMSGYWKKTDKYGMNFMVQTYREIIENTKEGITAYLSSVLSGIGKVTAERIYEKFGNDSLIVLEKEPGKLLAVKGITANKLKKIVDSYKEKYLLRELTEYLLPFGITAKQTVKLYNEEGIDTVENLEKNPYVLCNIHGVSIYTVDAIAKKLHLPDDMKERLVAHVNHVLIENEVNSGSTGMYAEDFGVELLKSLSCSCYTRANIGQYTIKLLKEGIIRHKKVQEENQIKTILYRPVTYYTEYQIADRLLKINSYQPKKYEDAKVFIYDYCKNNKLQLDDEQIHAILTAIENPITVITGGPGTGKTTIIKLIATYLKKADKGKMYFMAPSGRAARRITESTGFQATTIHKGINCRPGEIIPEDEKVLFEDSTIIVDEFSMVDVFLMNLLLECIKVGCRLIMVGDVNQLPSVGPGAVLRDIIDSDVVPVIKLEHIHRQTEDSMIYLNSQKIIRGEHDICEGSDFKMIQSESPEQAQEKMVDSYLNYVSKYGVEKIYCLCPCKQRSAGVNIMNEVLQSKINPEKPGKKEISFHGATYRIGDPVMHLKNAMEVSNGDIGYVTRIYENDGEKTMVATYFGDTEVEYTKDEADDVVLAYAFTVHKAQGSENKVILTFLSKTIGKRMLKRNLINTSITRGSEMVELYMTNDTALADAIDNDDSESRITSLRHHLEYLGGKFVKVS